jgi:hypothetical protein
LRLAKKSPTGSASLSLVLWSARFTIVMEKPRRGRHPGRLSDSLLAGEVCPMIETFAVFTIPGGYP